MPIRSTARLTVRSTFKFLLISLIVSMTALAPISHRGSLQVSVAQQNATGLKLGADFHPTHAQLETLNQRLPRTSEEKIFFHWTKPDIGLRWIQQGFIDSGEVEFYNTPTGDRQAYGPGIYMASNPTSSEGFGEFCVVFKMAPGTLVYSPEIAKEIFGRDLTTDEMTYLGKQIPFIRDLNGGDWHLTNSATNLTRVEYAGPYGGDAHMFRGSDQRTMLAAIAKAKTYGDTGYLESFFHLMHYMDGISLQRAIRVAPSNPWSQFEPALFENFRAMNDDVLTSKAQTTEAATWGPNEQNRDKWVDTQLKVTLPGLINRLYKSQGANFRGHGIRAGGTSDGHTFVATPQDLQQLLKNPYLKVEYRPDSTRQGFLVSYNYPSIQNLKNLKPLVSADVYETLSRYSIRQIEADRALEVRLNQTLIADLLRNLLNDLHGKQIDAADFLQRYISIHPFSDGNGRSGRLFLQKHLNLVGKSLPPFYISDLDLLVSKPTLAKIIEDSDKAYLSLQKAMLGEFIASGFGKKRMPDYFKLKQFQQLLTSLSVFGFNADDRVEPRFDQDVFERRFNELFSQTKGTAWSLVPDESLKSTLEFARKNGATSYIRALGQKTANAIRHLKPSPNVAAENLFLKNMMLYGAGLKELPSLKRAYMQKITQIVRKLDYTKPEHFDVRAASTRKT